jgi:hypothetical protein
MPEGPMDELKVKEAGFLRLFLESDTIVPLSV